MSIPREPITTTSTSVVEAGLSKEKRNVLESQLFKDWVMKTKLDQFDKAGISKRGIDEQDMFDIAKDIDTLYIWIDEFQNALKTKAAEVQIPKKLKSPLFHCSTYEECSRFDRDEIKRELVRRGFFDGGEYDVAYVTDKQLEENPTKAVLADDGTNKVVEADFNNDSTQPELIRILLAANKREHAKLAHQSKVAQRGDKLQGALPSETTNPYMYNSRNGLLKEEYLTQDHHGLTAFDFKGDKYRVEYKPKLNGYGGNATWVRERGTTPLPSMMLEGYYPLDQRGLPKLTKLNYFQHRGKVHKDKKGNFWQVHCAPSAMKNKKSKDMSANNCQANKKGEIPIVWGKFDPELTFDESQAPSDGKKKFRIPGYSKEFTFDDLNKLDLNEVLKILVTLELISDMPKLTEKATDMGIDIFGDQLLAEGMKKSTPLVKGKKVTGSMRTPQEMAFEEKLFREADLGECGKDGRPPIRCYSDTFIPGACVPHESICMKRKHRPFWMKSDKYGSKEVEQTFSKRGTSGEIMLDSTGKPVKDSRKMPALGWARKLSENVTEELTEERIKQIYRERADADPLKKYRDAMAEQFTGQKFLKLALPEEEMKVINLVSKWSAGQSLTSSEKRELEELRDKDFSGNPALEKRLNRAASDVIDGTFKCVDLKGKDCKDVPCDWDGTNCKDK